MLLKSFQKEIFRPKCNPGFESVHCYAHLDQDIGESIPYLNAELGGYQFVKNPPSVTFKIHGKLITVHARKIAINALKDEGEADKILIWLKNQINDIWNRRDRIQPCYQGISQPNLLEILKLLPKTNCKECGLPTCMVFAAQAVEGIKGSENCPSISPANREKLENYLKQFHLDSVF